MAPRTLDDDEHVARHCKKREINFDPKTGLALGVIPQAFELREKFGDDPGRKPETYLSAQWLEYFGHVASKDTHRRACEALRSRGRHIRAGEHYALINSKLAVECGKRYTAKVRLFHEPKALSPDYASIRGTSNTNGELLKALADVATVDLVRLDSL